MQELTEKDIIRFWSKVDRTSEHPTGCWLWKGSIHPVRFYGVFSLGRKMVLAHRVMYILEIDTIPDDMQVQHKCNTRPCVKPSHLKTGTPAENSAYMAETGRTTTTLTQENYNEIFVLKDQGYTNWEIANKTGVSNSTVGRVLRGEFQTNLSVVGPNDVG